MFMPEFWCWKLISLQGTPLPFVLLHQLVGPEGTWLDISAPPVTLHLPHGISLIARQRHPVLSFSALSVPVVDLSRLSQLRQEAVWSADCSVHHRMLGLKTTNKMLKERREVVFFGLNVDFFP